MPPKKSLGQNFLMHAQTAQRIAGAAKLTPETTVLEIGPGTGMLTRELLEVAGTVYAVEADRELIPVLEETFAQDIVSGKLILIHADIREFSANILPVGYALVANIPYYITGEIVRKFLTEANKPVSMTLLVQKEVAVRIARDPKESILSVSVKVFGTPTYCFTVPRGAFRPAPNVDSAVLSITGIRQDTFASPQEEGHFFSILRAGFSQKRKRLAKNLEQVSTKSRIEAAFLSLSLSTDIRAEQVSTPIWRELARLLS
jgi:16S rRNA (adenine1518-N6/adenine1519-N6)-dimethyltransferase